MRNFLNLFKGVKKAEDRRYPKVWSDFQKKHTVFDSELSDLKIWAEYILFTKIEGVILSGEFTGKDIDIKDFKIVQKALSNFEEMSERTFGKKVEILVITGSGLDQDTYKKYADFIITGTRLKRNRYWENEIDEDNVKKLVKNFK